MMEYPKIETLYVRDEGAHKVIVDQVRLPEFNNIRRWVCREKIDGTNIRVMFSGDGVLSFGGRTSAANLPASLVSFLGNAFTREKMREVFATAEGHDVCLYGEGYGERIQKGGGNYRTGVSFRLFDVLVGRWWLEQEAISDIAHKLGTQTAPFLCEIDSLPRSPGDLYAILGNSGWSQTAIEDGGVGLYAEGIVARTSPLLFTRRGERLIWKLKARDF